MNRQSLILIILGYALGISDVIVVTILPLNPQSYPAHVILGSIYLIAGMYFAGLFCVLKGVRMWAMEGKSLNERRAKWIHRSRK